MPRKIYSKHPWYLVTSSSKMVYRFCQIYENKIYDDKPDSSLQEEFEDTKEQSESVYRRRTDTMAKRKSKKGQTTINKTYI